MSADKILTKIANLSVLYHHTLDGAGLKSGCMGPAVFLYEYAHRFSMPEYVPRADALLDRSINMLAGQNTELKDIAELALSLDYLIGKRYIEAGDSLEEIIRNIVGSLYERVLRGIRRISAGSCFDTGIHLLMLNKYIGIDNRLLSLINASLCKLEALYRNPGKVSPGFTASAIDYLAILKKRNILASRAEQVEKLVAKASTAHEGEYDENYSKMKVWEATSMTEGPHTALRLNAGTQSVKEAIPRVKYRNMCDDLWPDILGLRSRQHIPLHRDKVGYYIDWQLDYFDPATLPKLIEAGLYMINVRLDTGSDHSANGSTAIVH